MRSAAATRAALRRRPRSGPFWWPSSRGRSGWAAATASHAERARLNVTRAIRAALANLAYASLALGRHLAATIRTGRYCSYTPNPRAPITWEL